MKKIIAVLFAFFTIFSLAACGSKSDYSSRGNGDNQDVYTTSAQTTPKTAIKTNLTYAREFQDGYAFVSFERGGTSYVAIINTKGEILYKSENLLPYPSSCQYVGDGVAAVRYYGDSDDITYALITVKGETLASSANGDFDKILGVGNNLAVVYKEEQDGISYKCCYALMNTQGNLVGNWVEDYKYTENYIDSVSYLGEGMFLIEDFGNKIQLFNQNLGRFVFYYEGYSFESTTFKNGVATLMRGGKYYNANTGYYETLESNVTLKSDGSFTIPANSDKIWGVSGDKVIVEEGDYLKIVGPDNTFTYQNYTSDKISNVYCYGDYTVISLRNEGNYFFTTLDKNGSQLYGPIATCLLNGFEFSESAIVYCTDYTGAGYKCSIIDTKSGELLASNIETSDFLGSFSDGMAPANISDSGSIYYFYVNKQGEKVLENLYE